MDKAQGNRIRRSFALFEPCGPAFIARVLHRLAESSPGTRALFPETTADLHAPLFDALKKIVQRADRFARVEPMLAELGRRAHARGATALHYAGARDALLATMRELARDDWSDQLHQDWEHVLLGVAGAMQKGALAPAARRAA